MGRKEMTKEYQSIKVRKDVYDDLKRMGVGIGKAIEILVKTQQEQITRKIENIEAVSNDIVELMLQHGVFDIRFAGAGINSVVEADKVVQINGYVNISIPNEEARTKLVEILRGEEGEESQH